MLTVRTSAHIPTNRHRRSFRLCPTSTGAPPARGGVSCLLREWRYPAKRGVAASLARGSMESASATGASRQDNEGDSDEGI